MTNTHPAPLSKKRHARTCSLALSALACALALFGCDNTPVSPPPPRGDSLWVRTFGGVTDDEAWGVAAASDGGVFIATHQTVPGPFTDAYVYRLRSDGSIVWERRWGGPYGEQVFLVTLADTVLYIAGQTQTTAEFSSANGLLLALSQRTGEVLWSYTYDQGYGYEEIDGVVVTPDAIYLSGWTTGQTTSNDVLLIRLTRDGREVWTRTWGSDGWDEANGHLVLIGDRLFIAGRYDAANILVGGDPLVAAFATEDGSLVWSRTSGTPGLLAADALGLTTDGAHLYAVGYVPATGLASQMAL
jgi:outer membrane protein assembly factor BamB